MRRLLFSVQQGKRALGVVLAQKKNGYLWSSLRRKKEPKPPPLFRVWQSEPIYVQRMQAAHILYYISTSRLLCCTPNRSLLIPLLLSNTSHLLSSERSASSGFNSCPNTLCSYHTASQAASTWKCAKRFSLLSSAFLGWWVRRAALVRKVRSHPGSIPRNSAQGRHSPLHRPPAIF